jgi:hypothetical protein
LVPAEELDVGACLVVTSEEADMACRFQDFWPWLLPTSSRKDDHVVSLKRFLFQNRRAYGEPASRSEALASRIP